jgi:hypothetical protein
MHGAFDSKTESLETLLDLAHVSMATVWGVSQGGSTYNHMSSSKTLVDDIQSRIESYTGCSYSS